MPFRMVSSRPLIFLALAATTLFLLIAGTRSKARLLPDISGAKDSSGQHNAGFSRLTRIYNSVAGELASNYTYSYCTTSTIPDTAIAHGWQPAEPATKYFWPAKPKPAGQSYTRGLAMARIKSEDVSWLEDPKLNVQKYIYVVDDPEAELKVPMNKGNEVMAYLTYIIDHYDDLPDINIFMHPHRYAAHNDPILGRDAVEILTRLNNDRVIHEGYVNLNCAHHMGCPNVLQDPRTRQPWADALLDFYARLYPDRPTPFEISAPCCSQFAVSRERIRGTSVAQYESYREWLLRSKMSNYHSGRVWEYLWHVIFTGLEVRCPAEHSCYCDTYGICFQGPADLGLFNALQRRIGEINARVEDIGKVVASGFGDMTRVKAEQKELMVELKGVKGQAEAMRAAAIKRGADPVLRAEIGNRKWNLGDE